MTSDNNSHLSKSTSSGKSKNDEFSPCGINPETFYPLAAACVLAGIGVKHMEEIKRKYRGEGIHQWGHDVGCFGRDLIAIFIKESELSNE